MESGKWGVKSGEWSGSTGQAQRHDRGDPMSIHSELELRVAGEKLRRLRQRSDEIRQNTDVTRIEKLTLQSLAHMIHQLEEEIAMFQTRIGASR